MIAITDERLPWMDGRYFDLIHVYIHDDGIIDWMDGWDRLYIAIFTLNYCIMIIEIAYYITNRCIL